MKNGRICHQKIRLFDIRIILRNRHRRTSENTVEVNFLQGKFTLTKEGSICEGVPRRGLTRNSYHWREHKLKSVSQALLLFTILFLVTSL